MVEIFVKNNYKNNLVVDKKNMIKLHLLLGLLKRNLMNILFPSFCS
jgi:hypothetical protein